MSQNLMGRKSTTKTVHVSIPLHTKLKVKASREHKNLYDFIDELLLLGLKSYIQNQKEKNHKNKETK